MSPEQKVLHVLNRLTYGPAPGDLETVTRQGVEAFIAQQLDPASIPENPDLAEVLGKYPTLAMDTVQLFREYGPKPETPGAALTPEAVLEAREQAAAVLREAASAKILRAISSSRQLEELLVDFWFNHFNVNGDKGLVHLWAGSFEREAVRPHVLGRFEDLLAATATHPAMLIFLDNWRNHVTRGDEGLPDYKGVNETYARVLLGAHALGPNAAISETDVNALAKILTGWRIGANHGDASAGGFFFDAQRHDPMDKMLLGHPVKGSGMAEGSEAFKILAEHPAAAEHVCRALAAYFLCDEPPGELVSRMEASFAASGGVIRAALETLFSSPEFFDERYYQVKFKRPFRLAVSAVRAAGTRVADPAPLLGFLDRMGMPPYRCQAPAGYKTSRQAWLAPGAMEERLFFAASLGRGLVPLAPEVQVPTVAALAASLGALASPRTLEAAGKAPDGLGAATILASPDFQNH